MGRDLPVELTTPTGAALLAALSSGFGPLPAMVVQAQGFGAGTRELDELPNCTQVVVGTCAGAEGGPDADAGQPVAVLEVTLDDVTGEQLAHTIGALVGAGAHDAWLAPVVMKKGRPGHVVHVLCDPADVRVLRGVLRSETGSPGVRMTMAERWPAARTFGTVVVDGQPIRVKATAARAKAEHDDVAAVARRTGRPLRDVAARAEAAWEEQRTAPDGTGADGGAADGGATDASALSGAAADGRGITSLGDLSGDPGVGEDDEDTSA